MLFFQIEIQRHKERKIDCVQHQLLHERKELGHIQKVHRDIDQRGEQNEQVLLEEPDQQIREHK